MKRLFTLTAMVCITLLFTISSYAFATNPLKGYEWLEGVWVVQNDFSWCEVSIDKSTYKIVSNITNGDISEIDLADKLPISITRTTNWVTGEVMLSLDGEEGSIGIDENRRQIFLIRESDNLYLSKTSAKGSVLPPKWDDISSYDWLEGTWVAQNDDCWGKVIIDNSTYKVVSSNWNNDMSEIDKAEAEPVSIAYINSSIFGKHMIALDSTNDYIGIAPSTKQVYLNLGEYTTLYLNKIPSQKAQETLPFLKGEYAYEYLRESKTMMNGTVINETRTETSYDENFLITGIKTFTNAQKTLEFFDYVYGDRTRMYKANTYMNGQCISSQEFSDSFIDDFYRNMNVSEIKTTSAGVYSIQKNEYSYDEQGRIIKMKQFVDGKLKMEQLNYVWTPNSCEYESITYFPVQSTEKVSKKFIDKSYVQNVCEIHIITINGVQTETKSEYAYDESGNLTSMKNFQDGQLVMEWKDYVWGDKKNTHIEIMYMNGSPMSTTEVTQFYL